MPRQLSHLNALDRTRTYNEAISMNVYCLSHPLAHLRPGLSRQGFARACDLRRMPSDSIVKVMGLTVIVHTPPTKSGKRVMFLTLEDETGLIDVVVFEKTQNSSARTILTSEVLALEGKLQRRGVNGLSISIVMRKAFKSQRPLNISVEVVRVLCF